MINKDIRIVFSSYCELHSRKWGIFFIGKEKIIVFPTCRENRWEGKGSC
jgi:hypothetical protein